ncbi:uncharacterized protein EV420DRAFT_1479527 [Desarmillaria tabescens]|uniref:Uncharacterized protein n=1 Tax=Armillaria tabescens TaxID=1929756 RepID=A0AA39KDK7_ARMTA|nr:uncharacterized protein EV420DRAFT_1479527 [Desarmillaria tabescens]KAK0458858.1 hypothetical protein EV420DRAFT_1479527 [Desarmillaria tabescens]
MQKSKSDLSWQRVADGISSREPSRSMAPTYKPKGTDLDAPPKSRRTTHTTSKKQGSVFSPVIIISASTTLNQSKNTQATTVNTHNQSPLPLVSWTLTHGATKNHKTTSSSVIGASGDEYQGSPRRGRHHRQNDPPEIVNMSPQRVTIVSEDNDEDWFGPTLPPSSPHVLEGPEDIRTPSTPVHPPPHRREATTYRFVHFDAPDPPLSPVESSPLPSPSSKSSSVLSHESSPSSSPSPTQKDSRGAGDIWPFFVEEDSHRICKLCRANKKSATRPKTYRMSTGTTVL